MDLVSNLLLPSKIILCLASFCAHRLDDLLDSGSNFIKPVGYIAATGAPLVFLLSKEICQALLSA